IPLGKNICANDDLECFLDSLEVRGDLGTLLPLADVDISQLIQRSEDTGTFGTPPAITNQPAAMTYDSPSATAELTIDFTDPNFATPGPCFSIVWPEHTKIKGRGRCVKPVRDGRASGSAI